MTLCMDHTDQRQVKPAISMSLFTSINKDMHCRDDGEILLDMILCSCKTGRKVAALKHHTVVNLKQCDCKTPECLKQSAWRYFYSAGRTTGYWAATSTTHYHDFTHFWHLAFVWVWICSGPIVSLQTPVMYCNAILLVVQLVWCFIKGHGQQLVVPLCSKWNLIEKSKDKLATSLINKNKQTHRQ